MVAILDIGSNSVRLMLWADGKSLYKKVSTTRLGEGASASGRLSDTAIKRTLSAIDAFSREARSLRAPIFAFATAAVRSAENGREFCALVKEKCDIDVDVVSGEEEASLGLGGALPPDSDGGIIDIGGASTELCFRRRGEITFRTSLPVGCVSLFDSCGDQSDALEAKIDAALFPLSGLAPLGAIYAIGGTASTLASIKLALPAYAASRLQNCVLEIEWMRREAETLLALKREEREYIVGMDKSRADIIAGGALLLAKIMERLHFPEVLFSDRDNLEGYLRMRGLG